MFPRDRLRKVFEALFHARFHRKEQARALQGRRGAPAGKGGLGRRHRRVGIFFGGERYLGDNFAVRWICHV